MIPENAVAAPGPRVLAVLSPMTCTAILFVLISLAPQAAVSAELELRYYGAEWCAPCRRVEPMVRRWAARHPDVRLVKLDYDSSETDRLRFDFVGVPLLVLLAGDKLVGKYGHNAQRVSDFAPSRLDWWYASATSKLPLRPSEVDARLQTAK
jgi:thiol-disulfide isomerase/thioredoxin